MAACRKLDQHRVYLCPGGLRKHAWRTVWLKRLFSGSPCPMTSGAINHSLRSDRADDQFAISHGNDLASGEVEEIPRIGRVMARIICIGIVVEHCVERKVVEIRKRKAWTSVKEMGGGIVVEVDTAASIIGIKPIFVAHIKVVDPARVSQVGVVAKRRAVREPKIINAVLERGLAGEKWWMGRGASYCKI